MMLMAAIKYPVKFYLAHKDAPSSIPLPSSSYLALKDGHRISVSTLFVHLSLPLSIFLVSPSVPTGEATESYRHDDRDPIGWSGAVIACHPAHCWTSLIPEFEKREKNLYDFIRGGL